MWIAGVFFKRIDLGAMSLGVGRLRPEENMLCRGLLLRDVSLACIERLAYKGGLCPRDDFPLVSYFGPS